MRIGIPRALLFYRYEALWQTFFTELGHEVVYSAPTDKQVLAAGMQVAIDESCLSCKVYLGHVASLVGRCDCIFVPRVANSAKGIFCTKFEALPDLTRNVFRGQPFLHCEVDWKNGKTEQAAYVQLGQQLGATRQASRAAYDAAAQALRAQQRLQSERQQAALSGDGLKVLLVGHGYNVFDPYVGGPVIRMLEQLGATPIFADWCDRDESRQRGQALSPSLPWTVNQELLGAVVDCVDRVDGIILMSAFPCGPDSMVNEMIVRRIHTLPILMLTMEAQDGSAGLETRLESFVDIIRFRREAAHG